MNKRHLSMLIGLLLIGAASCKKSSDSTSSPLTSVTDKIAKVQLVNSSSDTTTYNILYNKQGQVDSIMINTYFGSIEYISFVYSNSYYTITNNSGGGVQTSTVTTNADGTINSLVQNTNDTLYYSYNSSGIAKVLEDNYYATNYAWINGDIDSSWSSYPNGVSISNAFIFYYDLTHLWQMGDIISISDFLNYGRPIIISKHLMTGRGSNNEIEKYTYTFDSRSRIIKMTAVSENTVYYYTYSD